MIYTRLAVTPSDPARRDAVSAALFRAGAGGLLEEGNAFITLFDDTAVAIAAADAALAVDASATVHMEAHDPGDYTEAWRRGVRAHTIDRVTITPPWLALPSDAGLTVVIEPSTGFGTGEHESTRATLRLLQRVVKPGDKVADVGCGSGVLSIAAARLGASRVIGIDVDPQAIPNAEGNVALNGVGDRVSIIEGDGAALLPLVAPVRVIVANIISAVLIEMFDEFRAAMGHDREPESRGGDLIVGGLISDERDDFLRAAAERRWELMDETTEGAWWAAHLRPAP